MKAIWKDTVIAESDDTIVIEGNHYFPAGAVHMGYLQPSETTSTCPWKGLASYYSINVDGELNADAAWCYLDPKEAAKEIQGCVAFWRGVEVGE